MLVDGCVVTVGGADALSALGDAMGAVLDSPALSPDAISLPLSMITVARDLTYTYLILIRLLVLTMMVSRYQGTEALPVRGGKNVRNVQINSSRP